MPNFNGNDIKSINFGDKTIKIAYYNNNKIYAKKYPVTFTAGDYAVDAFTSTSSSATTGNESGTEYEYGQTVYYYVDKHANTAEYTYTCSGTLISGNIYRLGSVVIAGATNLGALSSITQTPNNFTLTINVPETGISQVWYKVGSGSYSQITFSGSAFTTPVPYGTSVSIYDVPSSGYTASYTSSSPLTFSMGTSGYTYSPHPATSTLTLTKNTGVDRIYYKVNGASSWSSTTSSTTVSVNYNTTVYWYAPAATGFNRNDSYTSSSSYATIANVKTSTSVSPTATVKSYTYTTGSKTGIASLICTRWSSPYGGASTGTVSNNGTIYYGDEIYFTATPYSGYETFTDYGSRYNCLTVTGNVVGVNYIEVEAIMPTELDLHIAFFCRVGSLITNSIEQMNNALDYNDAKTHLPNFVYEDYTNLPKNSDDEFVLTNSFVNSIIQPYDPSYHYDRSVPFVVDWTIADANNTVYVIVDVNDR